MFTNDQKILIKNRHDDRENDVIIKLKLSQNKIIEELQHLFDLNLYKINNWRGKKRW